MKSFWIYDAPLTDRGRSLTLFFLRLFVGLMMLTHGLAKLWTFSETMQAFPDPLGVNPTVSLVLVLLAEVGCSLLLMLGVFTRLAVLPLIFNMAVAAFFIHGSDPFSVKELPLLYLGIYIILFFLGGGHYSLDRLIFSDPSFRNTGR